MLGSILPAGTDTDWFLKELGIEKRVVRFQEGEWVLAGTNLSLIRNEDGVDGRETIIFDARAERAFDKENERRERCRAQIEKLKADPALESDPVLLRWERETAPLSKPRMHDELEVVLTPADPAHVKERIAFAKSPKVGEMLGDPIKWDAEDLYGYARAFTGVPRSFFEQKRVLDVTAGGGSIPFESLRLGCATVANELNPVASVILEATLRYPAQYGSRLIDDIEFWGEKLIEKVALSMSPITLFSPLPPEEIAHLEMHCKACPEIVSRFMGPEFDQIGLLYARQVTCPHCGGEAPLLNTCWLSKGDGDPWGAAVIPDGKKRNGTVSFRTYRVKKGKGPFGEDPDRSTVSGGKGTCVHCGQGNRGRGDQAAGEGRVRTRALARPPLRRGGGALSAEAGQGGARAVLQERGARRRDQDGEDPFLPPAQRAGPRRARRGGADARRKLGPLGGHAPDPDRKLSAGE